MSNYPDRIILLQPHPGHVVASLERCFMMIMFALRLRTSSKFRDKNAKKSTGTLDHWKVLSKCVFFGLRSSYRNEKCADRPIVNI